MTMFFFVCFLGTGGVKADELDWVESSDMVPFTFPWLVGEGPKVPIKGDALCLLLSNTDIAETFSKLDDCCLPGRSLESVETNDSKV